MKRFWVEKRKPILHYVFKKLEYRDAQFKNLETLIILRKFKEKYFGI